MQFSKVKSTKFLAELKRRVRSFENKTVAARIRVPYDLRWWYWLEFGTALRGENPAHKTRYPIDPVVANALSWPTPDGRVYRMHVDHPGIHPHYIVRSVLRDIRRSTGACIADAIVNKGFNINAIKQALMREVMPTAKQKIVAKMAVKAPGTRIDGKLKGQTAASVFNAAAQIVDSSDGRQYASGYAEDWMRTAAPTVSLNKEARQAYRDRKKNRNAAKQTSRRPSLSDWLKKLF